MFKSTKTILAAAVVTGLTASVAVPLVTHAQGWGAPQAGPIAVLDGPPPPVALMGPAGDPEIAMAGTHGGAGWAHDGRFLDGRIAFLKAVLKITPAQESAWDKLAAAMRAGAADRAKLHDGHDGKDAAKDQKDQPVTALQRVDWRARSAEAHAKSLAAFASAFKPLYDQLSDDQRKAADALFAPHHFRHG
jgi:hypothetical protein